MADLTLVNECHMQRLPKLSRELNLASATDASASARCYGFNFQQLIRIGTS